MLVTASFCKAPHYQNGFSMFVRVCSPPFIPSKLQPFSIHCPVSSPHSHKYFTKCITHINHIRLFRKNKIKLETIPHISHAFSKCEINVVIIYDAYFRTTLVSLAVILEQPPEQFSLNFPESFPPRWQGYTANGQTLN